MAHEVDDIGYPLDPELRRLEFQLGEVASEWREDHGNLQKQQQLVVQYHTIVSELYLRGWDSALDIESELPDRLLPTEYLRHNPRSSSTPPNSTSE